MNFKDQPKWNEASNFKEYEFKIIININDIFNGKYIKN